MTNALRGPVIAERRFSVAGRPGEIILQVGAPRPIPHSLNKTDMECPVLTDTRAFPELTQLNTICIAGVDSVQAVTLALKTVDAHAEYLNRELKGQLRWPDSTSVYSESVGGDRPELVEKLETQLKVIVGLEVSKGHRAANMRMFGFGPIRDQDGRKLPEYTLHVQCPWRIEDPREVITGFQDLYQPLEGATEVDWKKWDYHKDGNRQDDRLDKLFEKREEGRIVVKGIEADRFGGIVLSLSEGCRLVVFPVASTGEDWRFFRPGVEEHHLVFGGGKIEREDP